MLLIHEFSAGACWGPGSAAAISCHPRGNASAEPELEESSSPGASAAPSRAALTFHKWLLYLPAIPTYVPHPGLPLTRAHLYIPVNLAHLISEPFPLAPPWRGVALGFDPRSQRQCQNGVALGPGRAGLADVGVLPCSHFLPWARCRGCGWALVVQSQRLPSQPHAWEPGPSQHPKQLSPGPLFPASSSSISQIPDFPPKDALWAASQSWYCHLNITTCWYFPLPLGSNGPLSPLDELSSDRR